MIPNFPVFKPLGIEDRAEVVSRLMAHAPRACELSFATQFIWKAFDRPKLALLNDNLIIRIDPLNEAAFFLEPIGSTSLAETASILLQHIGRISRVTEGFLAHLSKGTNVEMLRDHCDYLYRVEELAQMRGRGFDGKRNHIKRFIKTHPGWSLSALTEEHVHEAMELFDGWCVLRHESEAGRMPELAYTSQRQALMNACSNYAALGFIGGALRVDEKLAGFIIASVLSADTLCVHFHYGVLRTNGMATMLLREACRDIFSPYEWINLEQDLGIPGLRRMKESYHPVRLEEKFDVTLA